MIYILICLAVLQIGLMCIEIRKERAQATVDEMLAASAKAREEMFVRHRKEREEIERLAGQMLAKLREK